MIARVVRSPMFATAAFVALALIYLYYIHRDLHAHHRQIRDLNQRLDVLQSVLTQSCPCPVQSSACDTPAVDTPAVVASAAAPDGDKAAAAAAAAAVQPAVPAPPPPTVDDEDIDNLSVASADLRSMLDVIDSSPPPTLSDTDLESLSLAQIKDHLRSQGQSCKGGRDTLLARLRELST